MIDNIAMRRVVLDIDEDYARDSASKEHATTWRCIQ
jgi:hypothetical protein